MPALNATRDIGWGEAAPPIAVAARWEEKDIATDQRRSNDAETRRNDDVCGSNAVEESRCNIGAGRTFRTEPRRALDRTGANGTAVRRTSATHASQPAIPATQRVEAMARDASACSGETKGLDGRRPGATQSVPTEARSTLR